VLDWALPRLPRPRIWGCEVAASRGVPHPDKRPRPAGGARHLGGYPARGRNALQREAALKNGTEFGPPDDEAAQHQPVPGRSALSEGSASGASDRRGRRIVASSEQDKRLRAELAEGLGFYPASLAAEDVARYREQIAERKARGDVRDRGSR
jgi:hypothetical protein